MEFCPSPPRRWSATASERLREHLRPRLVFGSAGPDRSVAQSLRDLLDEQLREGTALEEAARLAHAHPRISYVPSAAPSGSPRTST